MALEDYLSRDIREPVSVTLRKTVLDRIDKMVETVKESDPRASRSAVVDRMLEEKLDELNIK